MVALLLLWLVSLVMAVRYKEPCVYGGPSCIFVKGQIICPSF